MRLYPAIFRTVFSKMDPEAAHHFAFAAIRFTQRIGLAPLLRSFTKPAAGLGVDALGLRFPSPFGLAAGFDKGATGILALTALGFGHIEIGTVTAHAQPGNPKPRLFRLVADRALINRMGFNNDGAQAVLRRLERVRRTHPDVVIGVNIGKSRVTPVEEATDDYVYSAQLLAPLASYLVVNVSSPNTPGLRGLQEIDVLEPLLRAVQRAADGTPLLVKIAPDLTDEQIAAVAKLVTQLKLDGIIATNTTVSRDNLISDPELVKRAGEGGLSGAPLRQRSIEVLTQLRELLPQGTCIISVGGVESGADVRARLAAGATLVQGYTGFVFEGPLWARNINRTLAARAS